MMKGRIQGLIVERGMEGFSTPEIHGKMVAAGECYGRTGF
jgi:glutaryl-CoA dehydrogenase